MSGLEKKIFRFGVFEADVSTGELRKAGIRMRLQEQPFQVLVLFLERPGEVISRDEIQKKLWPSGTFVDFDHSLNTIINKIREALNDSASNPRFVETLAKRGYRFLAPVTSTSVLPPAERTDRANNQIEDDRTKNLQSENSSVERHTSSSIFQLTRMDELPVVSPIYVRTLFLLIQAMYLIFYTITLARLPAASDVIERVFGVNPSLTVIAIVSASMGIPLRLYMISAASFDIKDLPRKFLKIFPGVLILDELWAISPFLLAHQIGVGLALGMTAALAYIPFAQRTLVLMRERAGKDAAKQK
ncbi:MAG: winged helix-turn-helix domain-containing protein [Candidatus Sulfotelmatobacter sp.]|jgi:DNA-binding winged helix-turn-helix (wHTH) protein